MTTGYRFLNGIISIANGLCTSLATRVKNTAAAQNCTCVLPVYFNRGFAQIETTVYSRMSLYRAS